jgi:hypothetical protein
MESIEKFIILGAGIAIACIFIAFAVGNVKSNQKTAQDAADQAQAELATVINSDLKGLAGTTITGQQVLQYIAKAEKTTNYFIVVTNAAGGTTSYIYKNCSESTTTLPKIDDVMTTEEFNQAMALAKNASESSTYINPVARFRVASAADSDAGIIYDANGTFIGVVFKQIS